MARWEAEVAILTQQDADLEPGTYGQYRKGGHEAAIDAGTMVAAFVRAKYPTRCCSCGEKIAKGALIHWARDSKRTIVTHPGNCPQK